MRAFLYNLHVGVLTILFRYISNIEMSGGVIKYVPLQPPKHGAIKTSSAADWTLDVRELEKVFSLKTKMLVRPTHPIDERWLSQMFAGVEYAV